MIKETKVDKSIKVSGARRLQILMILPVAFLITALMVDDIGSIFTGLHKIIVHPDVLLTDYIEIGGLGATLVNSSILMLVNIWLLWKLDLKVNGPLIAALFTIGGFAFFGKNIFNVWPIYLGAFLYSRYQKNSFKSVILIAMFGTALSPLINEIAYGFNIPHPLGTIIGITVGILAGFNLPAISSHMLRVHDGYSLYNIGFTAGLIGTFIMSFMKSYGFTSESTQILSTDYDLFLKVFLFCFFIILLILGFIINNKSFKGYRILTKYSGRLVTDFTQLTNVGLTLINMGLMGLLGLIYVIISNGVMNGPIVGALLTIVGFAAFGKHPRNCIPILIGVFLGSLTNKWDVSSTTVIISALFGTTLAPIAGEYGWFTGIATGFIHLTIVTNVGSLHGGINLYNNGFSGGLVASVLVPIIDAFKKED